MRVTRKLVAEKLAGHLRHQISLPDLVDWAESAMMDGELEEEALPDIRDVVARLGLADVRAFGLTWEDCESLLKKLGYSARVEITAT
jgi:hypothetical protein